MVAPKLLEKLGYPRDLADLQKNFPLSGILDGNTGRVWNWYLNESNQFMPNRPVFIGSDSEIVIQAALNARAVTLQLDWLVEPYLRRGELVELFSDLPKHR